LLLIKLIDTETLRPLKPAIRLPHHMALLSCSMNVCHSNNISYHGMTNAYKPMIITIEGGIISLAFRLAANLSRSLSEGVPQEVVRRLAELLIPGDIGYSIVDSYVRRAARRGLLHRIPPHRRAFLMALRTWLSKGYKLRSKVVLDLVRAALAEIEIMTLRGRALAMGILVAIKRGLSKALAKIEELLVIGLQHINTPTIYRTAV